MAYHRQGAGETLLLVHGITTYSFIWRNIMPLLSRNYDVIAVDLIGCGDSDAFLPAAIAEKLHDEIPHSRLECIATAGHFIQEDEPAWLAQQILTFLSRIACGPQRHAYAA